MEVLLCSGYLVVGVLLSGLLVRFDLADTDDDLSGALLLFVTITWPMFIALALLSCVFILVHRIILIIGGK